MYIYTYVSKSTCTPSMSIKWVFLFRQHVFTESDNAKHGGTAHVMSNQAVACSILFLEVEEEEKGGVKGCRE